MDELSRATLVEKGEAVTETTGSVSKKAKLTADQAAEAFAYRVDDIKGEAAAGKLSPKKQAKLRQRVEDVKKEIASRVEEPPKATAKVPPASQSGKIEPEKVAEELRALSEAAENKAGEARRAAALVKRMEVVRRRKATIAHEKLEAENRQKEAAKLKAQKLEAKSEQGTSDTFAEKLEAKRKVDSAKLEAQKLAAKLEADEIEAKNREGARKRMEADEIAAKQLEAERLETEAEELAALQAEVEKVINTPLEATQRTKNISKKALVALVASGGLAGVLAAYFALRNNVKSKPKRKTKKRAGDGPAPFNVAVFERALRKDSEQWKSVSRRQS